VAVVGAGRTRGVGAAIFRNLAGSFRGPVYPVNPSARRIGAFDAFATLTDIPGPVDLAVIAVPAAAVDRVIDDCIGKQVGAVIVISAGFGETGHEGRASEAAIRDKVRRAGLRMIGPNCLGLVNTDPGILLNASFSPAFPPAGTVAFSSQSGALGLAILEHAGRLNLGISSFVSVGNKADVSTNDLLEYWEHDPRTRVILMYVESFGNPRRFSQICRRVGRTKPIVAVKAGRSRAGARAAGSHTGALAENDALVDALFQDAGVIRTETLEELFEVAALLSHQPLPSGPRVAILTNAGGPGILAADACDAHGLQVPHLAAETTAALRGFLPAAAGFSNPVDMLATASADDYRRAIPLLLADPAVDALLTIFIPPLVTDTSDVARAIAETARGSAKPMLATFFGAAGVPEILSPVPCYAFPESGVRALAHAVSHARWRRVPVESPPAYPDIERTAAALIVDRALAAGGGWLPPTDTFTLLAAAGIPAAPTRLVATAGSAIATAHEIGLPVVLKGAGPTLLHKTEARAVFTDLADDAAVLRAFQALSEHAGVTQVVIQPMVRGGVEMFVGAFLDATFGHLVMCGRGGTLIELLKDASQRLAPLTERTAREMLDAIRGIPLLRGFRGAPRLDEPALRDIVLRVSALVEACPRIVELDLNPVIVTQSGACVVDARVRVG
jgi:acyl-CoA synthetase (NDP forming)